jgi:hypothetical protein
MWPTNAAAQAVINLSIISNQRNGISLIYQAMSGVA